MSLTWKVQHVRVTAFPAPGVTTAKADLFRSFVGSDPEQTQTQVLGRIEAGPFSNGTLRISTQAVRIDLRLTPTAQAELETHGFAFCGSFPEALEPLVNLVHKKTQLFPPLNRLALGAMLIVPTTSREEAFNRLREFLQFVPDAENTEDFLYQLNRPRRSTRMTNMRINRLFKWSVANIQEMVIMSGLAPTLGEQHFGIGLELDVSSQANFNGIINPEEIGALLDDLVIACREIVDQRGAI